MGVAAVRESAPTRARELRKGADNQSPGFRWPCVGELNELNDSMQGQPKERESFRGACRALFKVLCGDFGSVRVDFAHPFSVQVSIKDSVASLVYVDTDFSVLMI